jgi:hypothetical protein
MPPMSRVFLAIMIALLLHVSPPVAACTIPVFRYALEHWSPSAYDIVVFHHGDFSKDELAMLRSIGKRSANAEIRDVDLAGKVDDDDQELWKAQEKTGELPWVIVRYPESEAQSPLAWSGHLSREGLLAALESPARKELAKRLMAGESCVWIVLGSADKEADDRIAKTLATEVKRLETTLTLPEIAADGPQIKSSLPLKLKFSVLRIARDDPRETAFVRMLRVAEPELAESEETLVIPVIGRGRAVSALAGSRVDGERIGAFAEFVSGQCSCEVKYLNPGIDLLMTANWDAIFEDGHDPAVDESPRDRPGKTVPIAPATRPTVIATTRPTVVATPHKIEPATDTQPDRQKWLIGAIAVTAAIALVSGLVAMRRRRN